MKANVGSADRVVRVLVGVALLGLLFVLEGNARFIGLVGLVPLLTAAAGFCPLYALLGIRTCKAAPGAT